MCDELGRVRVEKQRVIEAGMKMAHGA